MGTQSTWGLISRVSSRTYRSFGLLNNPTSKNIKMVFKKFVEIGRVVYVKESNQIAAVVDVIDSNHIIIDAPNVNRSKINLKRVELTKFRCEFLHGARTKTVNKAWAAADIDGQWAGSNWAKTLAKGPPRQRQRLPEVQGHEAQAGQARDHQQAEVSAEDPSRRLNLKIDNVPSLVVPTCK